MYCCAIKDVFSNRIVVYAINERMTAQLAVSVLRTAIARRQPTGVVVVHDDRGSQFRARSFRAVLPTAGLQGWVDVPWRCAASRPRPLDTHPALPARNRPSSPAAGSRRAAM